MALQVSNYVAGKIRPGCSLSGQARRTPNDLREPFVGVAINRDIPESYSCRLCSRFLPSSLGSEPEFLQLLPSSKSIPNGQKLTKFRSSVKVSAVVKRSPKRLKYASMNTRKEDQPMILELNPSGVDASRLHVIADMIKEGAVGVIPTDTVYAIVCDLKNRAAVERLYRVKNMDPKKPLSILCRNFKDIDTYTLGFPRGNSAGVTNVFRAARGCLPGPYTFILKASKDMPKQCTTFGGSTAAHCAPRKSVGVRMPDDAICQALLELLDEPLLCTSMNQQQEQEWLIDPAAIADSYGGSRNSERLDFIVDGGIRVAEPSTVIDMTGERAVVLRQGKGMLEDWMLMVPSDSLDNFIQANPYATVTS